MSKHTKIYKYNFKNPYARTLVNEIHKTLKSMSCKRTRVIPNWLYKKPDIYLESQYRLRKSNNVLNIES